MEFANPAESLPKPQTTQNLWISKVSNWLAAQTEGRLGKLGDFCFPHLLPEVATMLRRILLIGLLPILGILAPAAQAGGGPYAYGRQANPGSKAFWGHGIPYFPGRNANAGVAAPWYLYYPYEAYFNIPAPMAYPYWPAQGGMGAPSMGGTPGMYSPGYGNQPHYWGY